MVGGAQEDLNLRLLTSVRDDDVTGARSLIADGADVCMGIDIPGTDVQEALIDHCESLDMVKLLVDAGFELRPWDLATHMRIATPELISYLLDYGLPITRPASRYADWPDPLGAAAIRANVDVVRLLLKRGADPNSHDPRDRWTPLHWAVQGAGHIRRDLEWAYPSGKPRSQRRRAIQLILKAGSDVNAKNDKGETPLMLAAFYGQNEIVEQLLRAGARANALDLKNRSALYHADYGFQQMNDHARMFHEDPKMVARVSIRYSKIEDLLRHHLGQFDIDADTGEIKKN